MLFFYMGGSTHRDTSWLNIEIKLYFYIISCVVVKLQIGNFAGCSDLAPLGDAGHRHMDTWTLPPKGRLIANWPPSTAAAWSLYNWHSASNQSLATFSGH